MSSREALVHLAAIGAYPLIALTCLLSLLGAPPGLSAALSVLVLWLGLLTGLDLLRRQVVASLGSARLAKVGLRQTIAADRRAVADEEPTVLLAWVEE